MQIQRDRQPLLAGHAAVKTDLLFQCGGRCHGSFIAQFGVVRNGILFL
jgi:hypothetical protein